MAAVIGSIGLFLGLEVIEESDATAPDLLFELIEITPTVLTSVGVALLFRVKQRQRDEHFKLIGEGGAFVKSRSLVRSGDRIDRFEFVKRNQADYPVATLCHILGISTSGYYAWLNRHAFISRSG